MSRAGCALLPLLLTIGACGGDEPPPSEDPFTVVEQQSEGRQRTLRAAPRWEAVAILNGRGADAQPVNIPDHALQWRIRWRCSSGSMNVVVTGDSLARERKLGGPCRATAPAALVSNGPMRLEVRASGPWRVTVEQQVDRPLQEAPLTQMRAAGARMLKGGRFYDIERRGSGRADLYQLPSGRLALRLERFRTAVNTDLFVWLGSGAPPRTTKEAVTAPHREIGPLKSTAGDQNYLLPTNVRPNGVRSVVIWCEPVQIAYTAAALAP